MADGKEVEIRSKFDATGIEDGVAQAKASVQSLGPAAQKAGAEASKGIDGAFTQSIKRVGEATAEASKEMMSWTQFVKANMGPAMKAFSAEGAAHADAHTKAIRKIAEEWKVYKATGVDANQSVAQAVGASAAGLNSAQSRTLETIKRQAILLSEGRSALLAYRAAQAGISDEAAPFLAKAAAAEKGIARIGMSAKETAFALRGVPAQFTDIATSLAAGQRPLQVFLQQGGQLKDMFGGIGPAAKALGGYVLGLINPLTIAAAAAVGLFMAYKQGSAETEAYNRVLILTGNAAGTTADKLADMATRISATKGTTSAAAAALAEMAGSTKIGAANLEQFAATAIRMEQLIGVPVAKTRDLFESLADEPAKASLKLNETYNFLTASVYKQIKALEDQGRATDAVRLAQETFDTAMRGRMDALVQNLGTVERAWNGVIETAKRAWDAMLGVGRTSTLGEQMKEIDQKIAVAQGVKSRTADTGLFGMAVGGVQDARIASLQAQRDIIAETLRMESRSATAAGERTRQTQAQLELEKLEDKYVERRVKMEDEIGKARQVARDAGNKPEDLEQFRRIEAGIREKFDKEGKAAANAAKQAAKAAHEAYATLLGAITAKVAAGEEELDQGRKLTEVEKARLELSKEIDATTRKHAIAATQADKSAIEDAKAKALAIFDEVEAQRKLNESTLRRVDLAKEASETNIAQGEAIRTETESIRQQSAAEELRARQLGMSADQVHALAQEELDRRISMKETEAVLEDLKSKESGLGDAYRTQADELRGLKSAKDKSFLAEKTAKAADEARRAWEKTADDIERGLTDSFFRAAEAGKNAFATMRDAIKGMFNNLILRPIVNAIMRPVANTITGVVNGLLGGPTPGGGIGGIGQVGSTISGANSLISGAGTVGAYLSTLFSPAATDIGVNAAIAGGMDAAIAAGAAEGVAAGAAAAAGASSALATLATAAPYLAVAAIAIMAFMKEGGGPKSGGSAVATIAGGVMTQAERDARLYTPSGSDAQLLATTSQLAQQVNALAMRFGGSAANVRFGLGFDTDPNGTAPNRISAFAGNFSVTNRDLGRDPAALQKGIADEVIRLTLAGLQASDLTGGFAEFFARLDPATAAPEAITNLIALGDALSQLGEQAKYLPGAMGQVAALSAAAREALVGLAGGIDKLLSNQASFAQNFLSPEQRLSSERLSIGDAFKKATGSDLSTLTDGKSAQEIRDAFRDLVLGLDLTATSGAQTYTSLLALSAPMSQFITDLEALGKTAPAAADRIKQLTGEITSMQSSLESILNTAKKTPFERIQATIGLRDSITSARGNVSNLIQEQTIQGLTNRGDTAGAVAFLRGIEKTLWAQLGTAADDGSAAGKITDTVMRRVQLEASLTDQARTARIDGLRGEISALENIQRVAETLRDTIRDLTTGSLSALSPQAQLAASRAAFEQSVTAARGGDQKGLADVAGLGRAFLEEARSFFGSGGDFASIFQSVLGDLSSFGATLPDGTTLADARTQLAGLDNAQSTDTTAAVITELSGVGTRFDSTIGTLNDSVAAQVAAIQDAINVLTEQLAQAQGEAGRQQVRDEAIVGAVNNVAAQVQNLTNELVTQ